MIGHIGWQALRHAAGRMLQLVAHAALISAVAIALTTLAPSRFEITVKGVTYVVERAEPAQPS